MTSFRIKPGAEEFLAWCVEPASCSRSIFSSRYERFALSAVPTESLHSFEHIGLVPISRLSYLSPRLRYVTWRYQPNARFQMKATRMDTRRLCSQGCRISPPMRCPQEC